MSEPTPCPYCLGTGEEPDQKELGAQMRKLRTDAGLDQADVAIRAGMSGSYLSDLERGARRWNADLIERVRKACAMNNTL
jgi:transcriptional regulator with XRE-family HTH domain